MTAPSRPPEWHGREAVRSNSAAAVLLAPCGSVLRGSSLLRSNAHSCHHFDVRAAARQLCCLRQARLLVNSK